MPRWGMAVDLRKCVGCQTCTIICKQTNNTPPGVFWRRVADVEYGSYPDVTRMFLPLSCQHCAQPPCLEVCPTTATYKRDDGIVAIHADLCVGCGYCVMACPYDARSIIFEDKPYFAAGHTPAEVALADPDRLGTCTKCNLCAPRIDRGIARGLVPGVDPEATPACVASCIADALHFGDLDDPKSKVSRYIAQHETARLSEDLGTNPSIHYVVA